MKRNMELVRELLLRVEAEQGFDSLTSKYSQEEIVGHVEILLDAKLLDGKVYHALSGGPGSAHIQRLIWAGHEFLDNARNDTVWNKAISIIKDKSVSVSFDVLASLLKSLVSSSLSWNG